MEIAELVLQYIRALIWPVVVMIVIWTFRKKLHALLDRIQHAELPGGVAVDLAQEIREVKQLSSKVKEKPTKPDKRHEPVIPLTEANTRLLELQMKPSPSGLDMSYYRELAEQDPAIALAGLRIEIDILARNLAKGFNIPIDDGATGIRLLRRLYDENAITIDQMELTQKVLKVCDAAVHGSHVSREEAEEVIDSAEVLANEYLEWLSWGFDDDWTPTVE